MHKVLEKIRSSLERSFHTKEGSIEVKYNGSVVIYPREGKTFDDLFKKASLTLNLAKKEEVAFKFLIGTLRDTLNNFLKLKSRLGEPLRKIFLNFTISLILKPKQVRLPVLRR